MADVTLPQLGETVTEGTITRWFKQVGEAVAADEPLFEVSTDKVDTEVPSPVSGVVVEIRAHEGDTVPVGAVIAVVGEAAPSASPPPPPAPAPVVEAPAPAPAPVAETPVPVVEAPAPAPVVEAPAPAPAPVAEPAPVRGVSGDARLLSPVVRRLVQDNGIDPAEILGTGPGGRITREDVLDYLDARQQGATAAPAPVPAAAAPTPAPEPVTVAPEPVVPTAPPATASATPPAVATGARDHTVPLSKIRKLTGAHMVMSKSVSPHAFSVVEVDFANVDVVRSAVKDEWRATEGFGLTYLPFVSRAVIDALGEFPHLNASVAEDDLVVHGFVDLGIAVDLAYEGLLVPVVRDAETKRLRAIAREIHDLADRAKTRKLSPDEVVGGTFTITNNGSAGSVLTMAIINQPQVAILSTDAVVRRPVVVALPGGGESIAIHPVGHLAMTWDHRAFDGAYAAGFLVKVKEILETRDWAPEL
jgi:2-oxoglutarate dehydrogenase E2 component (dihydrolipoamide succinyltransferase)